MLTAGHYSTRDRVQDAFGRMSIVLGFLTFIVECPHHLICSNSLLDGGNTFLYSFVEMFVGGEGDEAKEQSTERVKSFHGGPEGCLAEFYHDTPQPHKARHRTDEAQGSRAASTSKPGGDEDHRRNMKLCMC